MDSNSKIYLSGHSGLVGNAVLNELKNQGFVNIITRTHDELDLLDQKATMDFFKNEKPEYVIHLAAKVGGINGNRKYPADFTYENMTINFNVIHAAHEVKVKKLLNFGSVCIYPVLAPIPIKEEYILTGPLEFTNEGYAISKIASLMLCKKYYEQYGDKFISVMPANIYGPFDNFHVENAHVIPMLMRRIHEAKESNADNVTVWGTGKPTRDFVYSKDVASAIVFMINNYEGKEHVNISTGVETSIKELAETLVKVIGFKGELIFDTTKPDGTPKRYMDVSKATSSGWKSKYILEDSLVETYKWFVENKENVYKKFPAK